MTYKDKFKIEYGHNYEAFRHWLKIKHNTNIGSLNEDERLPFIDEFLVDRKTYKFEEKYGFSRKSFYSYFKRRYDVNVRKLEKDDFDSCIDEYVDYLKINEWSIYDMSILLQKYIIAHESGAEVEVDDVEIDLINHLLNRELD